MRQTREQGVWVSFSLKLALKASRVAIGRRLHNTCGDQCVKYVLPITIARADGISEQILKALGPTGGLFATHHGTNKLSSTNRCLRKP